jgi:hypothetical protein
VPVEALKSFRVVSVPVDKAEDWLNELEHHYVNTAMAWFMKGDQQWVSLVFVNRRLMGGQIARPPGLLH